MKDKSNTHHSPQGFGTPTSRPPQEAIKVLRQKARSGTPGYPIATVAYYGPNEDIATKVAVGIVDKHQEVIDLRRWLSDGSEIRTDDRVHGQILEFIKRKRAKQVVITDGIFGCPHEEGIDYPHGEVCPQCPYWANS